MQLKTILNRVEKHKSFVYGKVRFRRKSGRLSLAVSLRPRRGSRPVCAGCGHRGPQYDRLAPRRFEFVPWWGLAVYFVYRMRRVDCRRCGVKLERVPWGNGRCRLTTTYRWFLAAWAKRLAWQEVGTVFYTSWQSVFRSVQYAVFWGIMHRKWEMGSARANHLKERHDHAGKKRRWEKQFQRTERECQRVAPAAKWPPLHHRPACGHPFQQKARSLNHEIGRGTAEARAGRK